MFDFTGGAFEGKETSSSDQSSSESLPFFSAEDFYKINKLYAAKHEESLTMAALSNIALLIPKGVPDAGLFVASSLGGGAFLNSGV